LVHKYKKLIIEHLTEWHQTKEYAKILNVTEKYLNECTQKVLNVSAKSLILEQLTMKSRRALKFSDNSVKEIAYNLGFTSSDYFCSFFKTHTGETPTQCRNL
jgi:AraC-like DNA-binding protein